MKGDPMTRTSTYERDVERIRDIGYNLHLHNERRITTGEFFTLLTQIIKTKEKPCPQTPPAG